MRLHELAKELHLTSKQLTEQLAKLKVSGKGPMSAVGEDVVARLRQAVGGKKTAKAAVVTKTAKTTVASSRSATRPSRNVAATTAKAKTAIPARPVLRTAPPKPAGVQPPVAKVPAPAAPVKPPVKPPPPPAAPAKPAVAAPAAPVREVVKLAPAAAAPSKPKPAPAPAAAPAPAPAAEAPAPAGALGGPGGAAPAAVALKPLQLKFPITVKDLSVKMDVKANELIKHLMAKRIFASLTQLLDQAAATQVARDFGFELAPQPTLEEQILQELAPDPAKLQRRAPVVTFMGHVDHGKTSLMDAIRESKVVEKEAGGITQHIGAYEVQLDKGRVTLLDTPGHEAFTALRARGANVTDVVVLVVAADDGVMPQTVEAIDHAKAADVPIVVAINKMDKPEADPQKVKQQLSQYGLQAEDWGGKTIMVSVSAKTRQGIDDLLEMLLLEAELLELKADPTKPASGTVIEARLSKDRGPIATLLVQQGTLRLGDFVVVGTLGGRVRAMINDRGHRVKDAQPGSPVEILGLPNVPKAGDHFMVMTNEKQARELVELRQEHASERAAVPPKRITLDDLHQRIAEGQLKELKLVLKADVQGSAEAITQSLQKIETEEVKLHLLHTGVGDISESDIMLAAASDAVVIGFHVGMEPQVQVEAVKEGVDVRIFKIIYELVNAIRAAIEGLLEPTIEETFLGRAEVRRLFQISKVGIIAGCMVTKGAIRRDALIRVIRGKERLTETNISNLKRVKDDVREVQEGFECGICLEGSTDLQPGDLLEAWELKKIARKLN